MDRLTLRAAFAAVLLFSLTLSACGGGSTGTDAGTATSSSGGGTATITGVATPGTVSVVTAKNAN